MEKLQHTIGYHFKNQALLQTALTHSSYVNESRQKDTACNERLEFLGDAVLGVVVTEYLYKHFPQENEGGLSKIRAAVVCEDSLVKIAKEWHLGDFLFLGRGEDKSGGRERKSILSDAVESVIAAVFLDGGMACAKTLVLQFIVKYIDAVRHSGADDFDYKTTLQELAHENGCEIEYKVLEETGPDHDKRYLVSVCIDGKERGRGSGASKKRAEQAAAAQAVKRLEQGRR